jgi:hypothetical protein
MTLNLSDFPNVFILGNYSRKDIACMSPLPCDAYVATFSELNGIAYQVCKYLLTCTTVVKTRSHLNSQLCNDETQEILPNPSSK